MDVRTVAPSKRRVVCMSRYYFHIRAGWDLIPDDEGMEFPDLDRAEMEGHASARDLGLAALRERRSCAAYALEVSDATGKVLKRIRIDPVPMLA